MSYTGTIYRGSRNLGDAIQTLTLGRLIRLFGGVYRDNFTGYDGEDLHVVNGFLSGLDEPGDYNALFAGVHLCPDKGDVSGYLRWMEKSQFPIGARDPWTKDFLDSKGIGCQLVGCSSLTLPILDDVDRSSKVALVDSDKFDVSSSIVRYTHEIGMKMPWAAQWRKARRNIGIYRCSSLVVTSRLHAATVCIGSGVPLVVEKPGGADADRRFSLLDAMGFRYDVVHEVSRDVVILWRSRYIEFLKSCVDVSIVGDLDFAEPI